MPRQEETHEWKQVSFPELVTAIGNGTSFSVDQLIGMISGAEKDKEDFRIIHAGERYAVPFGLIQDYFKDHARPAVKMSLKDEVEYLRRRVRELEADIKYEPAPVRPPREHAAPSEPAPPPRDQDIPRTERLSPEDITRSLKEDLQKTKPKRITSKREKAAEAGL